MAGSEAEVVVASPTSLVETRDATWKRKHVVEQLPQRRRAGRVWGLRPCEENYLQSDLCPKNAHWNFKRQT